MNSSSVFEYGRFRLGVLALAVAAGFLPTMATQARVTNAISSATTWAEKIQYAAGAGGATILTATSDGGSLQFSPTGALYSAEAFTDQTPAFIKLSSTGAIAWSTAFGPGVSGFRAINLYEIQETAGTSYFAIGEVADGPNNTYAIVVIKLSDDGKMVWTRIFDEAITTNTYGRIQQATLSGANTFMLGGYIDLQTSTIPWVVEIDVNGNMLRNGAWNPSVSSDSLDSVIDMAQDGSDWILLVGSENYGGTSSDFSDDQRQIKIVTVKSDLSVVSEKILGFSSITDEGIATPHRLIHLKDGSWAIMGYLASMAQYSENAGHNTHSQFFATLSAGLSQITALRILNSSNKSTDTIDYLGQAMPLASGNYTVMGFTGDVAKGTPYLVEFDKNQQIIWGSSYGNANYAVERDLASPTLDGGYIIGFTKPTYSGDDSFVVAKLDSRGAVKKSIPCFAQTNGISKLFTTLAGKWEPKLIASSNKNVYGALPLLSALDWEDISYAPFEELGDAQASVTQQCGAP